MSKSVNSERTEPGGSSTELKHKDFIVALYFIGMHGNKAEGQASLPNYQFAIENSTAVGCACMWAKANLDNDMSVIYDVWSLEIQKNDIMHRVIKRTLGMA